MFLKYQLRKPFSRKIRVGTDAILDAAGRLAYTKKFGPLIASDPLAGAIAALAAIYDGDGNTADMLMDQLATKAPRKAFRKLFETSDLRKFMMAALRDYYAGGDTLDASAASRLRDFSTSFDPESRHVFDPPAYQDKDVSLQRFDYEAKAPKGLSIGIYFRSKFYPTSRPHDVAYRFQSAFAGAGAICEIVEPDTEPDRFIKCDIALIDDPHIFRKSAADKRRFIEKARRHAKCLVMIEMDPWAPGRSARLAANRDLYDIVWAMMPSLMDADGTIDGLKASCMLFPVGAPDIFRRYRRTAPDMPGDDIKFCGGIEEYNFYRYFWIVGALAGEHPPVIEVTNHGDDGLGVAESLERYVKRLGASHACLNFIRRATGETSMVGRTSDALCLEQLLVQEASVEVRPYFTPGEHFVQFRTLGELDDICARLGAQRSAFEDVRRAGASYFDAHFSDDAVLRHLATWC